MKTTTERRPLEYYLNLKYPVTIYTAPEGGYVAEIEDLPGCLAQGETLTGTFEQIDIASRLWLETAYEDGLDITQPRIERKYSGKFVVRIPRSLHRKLDQQAEREGVSLNQYVVATLSHAYSYIEPRKEL